MAHQSPLPPLVLVHGYPLDGSIWRQQVGALEKAGHKAFAPDLLGFGKSPARESAGMDDYADDIYQLIQRQCGGRAIVGGFSMGGYVLMALLREHPEAVQAAMFIDTRCEADTPEARAGRETAIEQVRKGGVAAICEPLLDRLLSRHASPAIRRTVSAMIGSQSATGVVAALQAMARRHDSSELLSTLKIPAMVLVGDHDVITPPAVAITMQNHMPHAMLVQIADAGHMAMLEQPEAVSKAMLTFLATM